MRVDIRDGVSGPILCSSPVNEQECVFEMKKKKYQLTIGFTSDLGEGEKVVSQILDGIAAHTIRTETLALSKKITSMLTTLGKTNPGYRKELNNLSKQIIGIDPLFEFTSPNLAKLQLTWQKTLTLQKKIKSYPRLVSISCYKGSLVTKISAVNPRCPTGYRQR
jgi:hypothetical protein